MPRYAARWLPVGTTKEIDGLPDPKGLGREMHDQRNDTSLWRLIEFLQAYSIPLVVGVLVALIWSNVDPYTYERIVDGTYSFFTDEPFEIGEDTSLPRVSESDGHHDWRHWATMHFVVNDLFMVFFFGIAAKEITEACLPGGSLNPVSKALNPMIATIGGVVGPIAVYVALNTVMGQPEWSRGWGIPTATDIALAWLVARLVFGAAHPAVSFLLLLAVADDGIGLIIIAIFYPTKEPQWLNLIWILPGMFAAWSMRIRHIQSWVPYVAVGGSLSWWGLHSAHLHPALALVPIIPFLPGPKEDTGLFTQPADKMLVDPLNRFDDQTHLFVDLGMFFFAFANAGVAFSHINHLTWIVLISLLLGKTLGITLFAWLGTWVGCPYPSGVGSKHVFVLSIVAGIGLTVALFVTGQAFQQLHIQGAAKMGALFSGGIAILAIFAGKSLRVRDEDS